MLDQEERDNNNQEPMAKPGSGSRGTHDNVPIILHIDMDAFFVSVEQALDPSLKGKPLIVGGREEERHGVVCSASYETRAYGVRSAMPIARALKLCPQAIIITPEHNKYIEYSREIRRILHDFSPLVEMASVDEAYVDLTGTERLHGCGPMGIADKIRRQIHDDLDLPCSCGIATNRLVAKIASDCAKPRGQIHVLPGEERSFLRPLKIEKMPGIGPRSAELLHSFGFVSIGDIQDIGEEWMVKHLGVHGRNLYQQAIGEGSSKVNVERRLPKSVSRSATYFKDLRDILEIQAALSLLSEKVTVELRRIGALATVIGITVRYGDFKTITRSEKTRPTNDEGRILSCAEALFARGADSSRPIRLLGVAASGLVFGAVQNDLFERGEEREHRDRLHSSIDRIKNRYGFRSIIKGTSYSHPDKKKKTDPSP